MEKLYGNKGNRLEEAVNFIAILMIVLMSIILLLNTLVFMRVKVSGPSMENTLQTGDFLFVNKLGKADYGDIIVVQANNKLVIKRLIAKGGDCVKIEDGNVFVKYFGEEEFTRLVEPYTKQGITTVEPEASTEWELKENEIFYLGDNRYESSDCRDYGPINEKNIVGVVTGWSIKYKKILTKLN